MSSVENKMNAQTKLMLSSILLMYEFVIMCKDFKSKSSTTKDHSITVYVHGTYAVRKILEYSFGRPLVYCPQGISLAKNLPSHYHFHKMAQGFVQLNSELYNLDQFYLFGWPSENVYDKVRQQAGMHLAQELHKLVIQYWEQYHIVPKLRLIGFSHGGNVILYIAKHLPLSVQQEIITIEAWIFGTPIQQVNKHLVNSPYFAKVYSFYSKKDWIQRMDPQGLRNYPFSIKRFWSDRTFDFTDRCVQVEFTVNGKPIGHTYYRSIFKHFPTIQKLTEDKAQNLSSGCIAINLIK